MNSAFDNCEDKEVTILQKQRPGKATQKVEPPLHSTTSRKVPYEKYAKAGGMQTSINFVSIKYCT